MFSGRGRTDPVTMSMTRSYDASACASDGLVGGPSSRGDLLRYLIHARDRVRMCPRVPVVKGGLADEDRTGALLVLIGRTGTPLAWTPAIANLWIDGQVPRLATRGPPSFSTSLLTS